MTEKNGTPAVDNEIILSTGIVLKLKPVPPFLVRRAATALRRPIPPQIELDGGRKEPNPSDPDYLRELDEYESQTLEVGMKVMMIMGTEVLSLPEGVFPSDSDEWLTQIRAIDIEVPAEELDDPTKRKYAWLRYYALASTADIVSVSEGLTKLSGLPEEEVKKAVESFRGGEGRRAARSSANSDS